MQPFYPNDSKQMNKSLGIREKQPSGDFRKKILLPLTFLQSTKGCNSLTVNVKSTKQKNSTQILVSMTSGKTISKCLVGQGYWSHWETIRWWTDRGSQHTCMTLSSTYIWNMQAMS